MCRNIKVLYNFDPPASDDEILASSLQFVRKISGFRKPSVQNEKIFNQTVQDITKIIRRMIDTYETNAPAKNREAEAEKARKKAIGRSEPKS